MDANNAVRPEFYTWCGVDRLSRFSRDFQGMEIGTYKIQGSTLYICVPHSKELNKFAKGDRVMLDLSAGDAGSLKLGPGFDCKLLKTENQKSDLDFFNFGFKRPAPSNSLVKHDGNCFYNSLFHLFKGEDILPPTPQHLKELVIAFIYENEELTADYEMEQKLNSQYADDTEETWQKKKKNVILKCKYVTQAEIKAFSIYWNVNLLIKRTDGMYVLRKRSAQTTITLHLDKEKYEPLNVHKKEQALQNVRQNPTNSFGQCKFEFEDYLKGYYMTDDMNLEKEQTREGLLYGGFVHNATVLTPDTPYYYLYCLSQIVGKAVDAELGYVTYSDDYQIGVDGLDEDDWNFFSGFKDAVPIHCSKKVANGFFFQFDGCRLYDIEDFDGDHTFDFIDYLQTGNDVVFRDLLCLNEQDDEQNDIAGDIRAFDQIDNEVTTTDAEYSCTESDDNQSVEDYADCNSRSITSDSGITLSELTPEEPVLENAEDEKNDVEAESSGWETTESTTEDETVKVVVEEVVQGEVEAETVKAGAADNTLAVKVETEVKPEGSNILAGGYRSDSATRALSDEPLPGETETSTDIVLKQNTQVVELGEILADEATLSVPAVTDTVKVKDNTKKGDISKSRPEKRFKNTVDVPSEIEPGSFLNAKIVKEVKEPVQVVIVKENKDNETVKPFKSDGDGDNKMQNCVYHEFNNKLLRGNKYDVSELMKLDVNVKYVVGDFIKGPNRKVQQLTISLTSGGGLAAYIAKSHPECDGYRVAPKNRRLGRYSLKGFMYNLWVQRYATTPTMCACLDDCKCDGETYKQRYEYFEKAFNNIKDTTIDVPYGIGCGIAGGCWLNIHHILAKSGKQVYVYMLQNTHMPANKHSYCKIKEVIPEIPVITEVKPIVKSESEKESDVIESEKETEPIDSYDTIDYALEKTDMGLKINGKLYSYESLEALHEYLSCLEFEQSKSKPIYYKRTSAKYCWLSSYASGLEKAYQQAKNLVLNLGVPCDDDVDAYRRAVMTAGRNGDQTKFRKINFAIMYLLQKHKFSKASYQKLLMTTKQKGVGQYLAEYTTCNVWGCGGSNMHGKIIMYIRDSHPCDVAFNRSHFVLNGVEYVANNFNIKKLPALPRTLIRCALKYNFTFRLKDNKVLSRSERFCTVAGILGFGKGVEEKPTVILLEGNWYVGTDHGKKRIGQKELFDLVKDFHVNLTFDELKPNPLLDFVCRIDDLYDNIRKEVKFGYLAMVKRGRVEGKRRIIRKYYDFNTNREVDPVKVERVLEFYDLVNKHQDGYVYTNDGVETLSLQLLIKNFGSLPKSVYEYFSFKLGSHEEQPRDTVGEVKRYEKIMLETKDKDKALSAYAAVELLKDEAAINDQQETVVDNSVVDDTKETKTVETFVETVSVEEVVIEDDGAAQVEVDSGLDSCLVDENQLIEQRVDVAVEETHVHEDLTVSEETTLLRSSRRPSLNGGSIGESGDTVQEVGMKETVCKDDEACTVIVDQQVAPRAENEDTSKLYDTVVMANEQPAIIEHTSTEQMRYINNPFMCVFDAHEPIVKDYEDIVSIKLKKSNKTANALLGCPDDKGKYTEPGDCKLHGIVTDMFDRHLRVDKRISDNVIRCFFREDMSKPFVDDGKTRNMRTCFVKRVTNDEYLFYKNIAKIKCEPGALRYLPSVIAFCDNQHHKWVLLDYAGEPVRISDLSMRLKNELCNILRDMLDRGFSLPNVMGGHLLYKAGILKLISFSNVAAPVGLATKQIVSCLDAHESWHGLEENFILPHVLLSFDEVKNKYLYEMDISESLDLNSKELGRYTLDNDFKLSRVEGSRFRCNLEKAKSKFETSVDSGTWYEDIKQLKDKVVSTVVESNVYKTFVREFGYDDKLYYLYTKPTDTTKELIKGLTQSFADINPCLGRPVREEYRHVTLDLFKSREHIEEQVLDEDIDFVYESGCIDRFQNDKVTVKINLTKNLQGTQASEYDLKRKALLDKIREKYAIENFGGDHKPHCTLYTNVDKTLKIEDCDYEDKKFEFKGVYVRRVGGDRPGLPPASFILLPVLYCLYSMLTKFRFKAYETRHKISLLVLALFSAISVALHCGFLPSPVNENGHWYSMFLHTDTDHLVKNMIGMLVTLQVLPYLSGRDIVDVGWACFLQCRIRGLSNFLYFPLLLLYREAYPLHLFMFLSSTPYHAAQALLFPTQIEFERSSKPFFLFSTIVKIMVFLLPCTNYVTGMYYLTQIVSPWFIYGAVILYILFAFKLLNNNSVRLALVCLVMVGLALLQVIAYVVVDNGLNASSRQDLLITMFMSSVYAIFQWNVYNIGSLSWYNMLTNQAYLVCVIVSCGLLHVINVKGYGKNTIKMLAGWFCFRCRCRHEGTCQKPTNIKTYVNIIPAEHCIKDVFIIGKEKDFVFDDNCYHFKTEEEVKKDTTWHFSNSRINDFTIVKDLACFKAVLKVPNEDYPTCMLDTFACLVDFVRVQSKNIVNVLLTRDIDVAIVKDLEEIAIKEQVQLNVSFIACEVCTAGLIEECQCKVFKKKVDKSFDIIELREETSEYLMFVVVGLTAMFCNKRYTFLVMFATFMTRFAIVLMSAKDYVQAVREMLRIMSLCNAGYILEAPKDLPATVVEVFMTWYFGAEVIPLVFALQSLKFNNSFVLFVSFFLVQYLGLIGCLIIILTVLAINKRDMMLSNVIPPLLIIIFYVSKELAAALVVIVNVINIAGEKQNFKSFVFHTAIAVYNVAKVNVLYTVPLTAAVGITSLVTGDIVPAVIVTIMHFVAFWRCSFVDMFKLDIKSVTITDSRSDFTNTAWCSTVFTALVLMSILTFSKKIRDRVRSFDFVSIANMIIVAMFSFSFLEVERYKTAASSFMFQAKFLFDCARTKLRTASYKTKRNGLFGLFFVSLCLLFAMPTIKISEDKLKSVESPWTVVNPDLRPSFWEDIKERYEYFMSEDDDTLDLVKMVDFEYEVSARVGYLDEPEEFTSDEDVIKYEDQGVSCTYHMFNGKVYYYPVKMRCDVVKTHVKHNRNWGPKGYQPKDLVPLCTQRYTRGHLLSKLSGGKPAYYNCIPQTQAVNQGLTRYENKFETVVQDNGKARYEFELKPYAKRYIVVSSNKDEFEACYPLKSGIEFRDLSVDYEKDLAVDHAVFFYADSTHSFWQSEYVLLVDNFCELPFDIYIDGQLQGKYTTYMPYTAPFAVDELSEADVYYKPQVDTVSSYYSLPTKTVTLAVDLVKKYGFRNTDIVFGGLLSNILTAMFTALTHGQPIAIKINPESRVGKFLLNAGKTLEENFGVQQGFILRFTNGYLANLEHIDATIMLDFCQEIEPMLIQPLRSGIQYLKYKYCEDDRAFASAIARHHGFKLAYSDGCVVPEGALELVKGSDCLKRSVESEAVYYQPSTSLTRKQFMSHADNNLPVLSIKEPSNIDKSREELYCDNVTPYPVRFYNKKKLLLRCSNAALVYAPKDLTFDKVMYGTADITNRYDGIMKFVAMYKQSAVYLEDLSQEDAFLQYLGCAPIKASNYDEKLIQEYFLLKGWALSENCPQPIGAADLLKHSYVEAKPLAYNNDVMRYSEDLNIQLSIHSSFVEVYAQAVEKGYITLKKNAFETIWDSSFVDLLNIPVFHVDNDRMISYYVDSIFGEDNVKGYVDSVEELETLRSLGERGILNAGYVKKLVDSMTNCEQLNKYGVNGADFCHVSRCVYGPGADDFIKSAKVLGVTHVKRFPFFCTYIEKNVYTGIKQLDLTIRSLPEDTPYDITVWTPYGFVNTRRLIQSKVHHAIVTLRYKGFEDIYEHVLKEINIGSIILQFSEDAEYISTPYVSLQLPNIAKMIGNVNLYTLQIYVYAFVFYMISPLFTFYYTCQVSAQAVGLVLLVFALAHGVWSKIVSIPFVPALWMHLLYTSVPFYGTSLVPVQQTITFFYINVLLISELVKALRSNLTNEKSYLNVVTALGMILVQMTAPSWHIIFGVTCCVVMLQMFYLYVCLHPWERDGIWSYKQAKAWLVKYHYLVTENQLSALRASCLPGTDEETKVLFVTGLLNHCLRHESKSMDNVPINYHYYTNKRNLYTPYNIISLFYRGFMIIIGCLDVTKAYQPTMQQKPKNECESKRGATKDPVPICIDNARKSVRLVRSQHGSGYGANLYVDNTNRVYTVKHIFGDTEESANDGLRSFCQNERLKCYDDDLAIYSSTSQCYEIPFLEIKDKTVVWMPLYDRNGCFSYWSQGILTPTGSHNISTWNGISGMPLFAVVDNVAHIAGFHCTGHVQGFNMAYVLKCGRWTHYMGEFKRQTYDSIKESLDRNFMGLFSFMMGPIVFLKWLIAVFTKDLTRFRADYLNEKSIVTPVDSDKAVATVLEDYFSRFYCEKSSDQFDPTSNRQREFVHALGFVDMEHFNSSLSTEVKAFLYEVCKHYTPLMITSMLAVRDLDSVRDIDQIIAMNRPVFLRDCIYTSLFKSSSQIVTNVYGAWYKKLFTYLLFVCKDFAFGMVLSACLYWRLDYEMASNFMLIGFDFGGLSTILGKWLCNDFIESLVPHILIGCFDMTFLFALVRMFRECMRLNRLKYLVDVFTLYSMYVFTWFAVRSFDITWVSGCLLGLMFIVIAILGFTTETGNESTLDEQGFLSVHEMMLKQMRAMVQAVFGDLANISSLTSNSTHANLIKEASMNYRDATPQQLYAWIEKAIDILPTLTNVNESSVDPDEKAKADCRVRLEDMLLCFDNGNMLCESDLYVLLNEVLDDDLQVCVAQLAKQLDVVVAAKNFYTSKQEKKKLNVIVAFLNNLLCSKKKEIKAQIKEELDRNTALRKNVKTLDALKRQIQEEQSAQTRRDLKRRHISAMLNTLVSSDIRLDNFLPMDVVHYFDMLSLFADAYEVDSLKGFKVIPSTGIDIGMPLSGRWIGYKVLASIIDGTICKPTPLGSHHIIGKNLKALVKCKDHGELVSVDDIMHTTCALTCPGCAETIDVRKHVGTCVELIKQQIMVPKNEAFEPFFKAKSFQGRYPNTYVKDGVRHYALFEDGVIQVSTEMLPDFRLLGEFELSVHGITNSYKIYGKDSVPTNGLIPYMENNITVDDIADLRNYNGRIYKGSMLVGNVSNEGLAYGGNTIKLYTAFNTLENLDIVDINLVKATHKCLYHSSCPASDTSFPAWYTSIGSDERPDYNHWRFYVSSDTSKYIDLAIRPDIPDIYFNSILADYSAYYKTKSVLYIPQDAFSRKPVNEVKKVKQDFQKAPSFLY